MKRLIAWIDHRTGYQKALHEALYENIPSGARWRYVSGSALAFAFMVQAVTGIFLWMAYSPSSRTAWESVYYIQYEMTGGWLLRGVHHFMAQAMIVLLGLHLLQVIVDGAYRAPREFNYWIGIILMQLVLALGLTGYLLPWDQKGYWATNVATNLMTLVPYVGKDLQQLVLGSGDYGHHTLTRFFALHAGVLPGLLIVFLVLHLALFRRHGITAKRSERRRDQYFWPNQVLLDGLACLIVLVIVLLCTIHFDVGGLAQGNLPEESRGADLGAPADPTEQYSAARPEWYFLFLFQMLKYFKSEFVGAIVVPGAMMTMLALAPFLGYFKWGHRFNIVLVIALLLGAGVLTGVALYEDSQNESFVAAKEEAHQNAQRVKELMRRRRMNSKGEESPELMLPSTMAGVSLLRNDPWTQGPRLFERHCGSCHAYADPAGVAAGGPGGQDPVRFTPFRVAKQQPQEEDANPNDAKVVREVGEVAYQEHGLTAPNLYRFASRDWVRGLLDYRLIDKFEYGDAEESTNPAIAENKEHPDHFRQRIISPYFGNTAHKDGRMAQWVKKHLGSDKAERKLNDEELNAVVIALSAQAKLPRQAVQDAADAEVIQRGLKLMKQTCAGHCHRIEDAGQLGLAPDLTGYGSYEWMMGLITDPEHLRYYRRENDRMPAFAKDLSNPRDHQLSIREISLIVDWLRGEYYRQQDLKDGNPQFAHTQDQAERAAALARIDGPAASVKQPGAPAIPDKERARELFVQNCSACHHHLDEFGRGVQAKQPTAPNLYGFGSRKWLAGLLDPQKIASLHYFGGTTGAEDREMIGFVNDSLTELDEEKRAELEAAIAALSAEAQLPAQKEADQQAQQNGLIEKGRTAIVDTFACIDCHAFRDEEGSEEYPQLTGWGSLDWIKGMIANPHDVKYYGENNDRMPRFGASTPGKPSLLSEEDITLLAKWLRGEL